MVLTLAENVSNRLVLLSFQSNSYLFVVLYFRSARTVLFTSTVFRFNFQAVYFRIATNLNVNFSTVAYSLCLHRFPVPDRLAHNNSTISLDDGCHPFAIDFHCRAMIHLIVFFCNVKRIGCCVAMQHVMIFAQFNELMCCSKSVFSTRTLFTNEPTRNVFKRIRN